MGAAKSGIDFVLHVIQFGLVLFIAGTVTIILRNREGLTCLLDGIDGATSSRICTVTYIATATSAVGSLVISLLTCATCCLCGLPDAIEGVGSLLLGLGWVGVGAYVTRFVKAANDAGFAHRSWRQWVLYAMYGVAAAFLASGLVNCGSVCCGRGSSRGHKNANASPAMV
ncbi:hypothetical protein MMPV_003496 [Pyropia vietnamensis]